MSVYAGKCRHFPENSSIATMIRFESEALGTTAPAVALAKASFSFLVDFEEKHEVFLFLQHFISFNYFSFQK